MVKPILRQLRARQQNYFCVGVELICIADHLNVVLRPIIHPNNNVFMKGGRDGQLAEVHMSNSQSLFLPRHQKISIWQKHNFLLRPLLSNNLTSYRANMEQQISALTIEKTICLLQAWAAGEKLSDRNYIIFYEKILYSVVRCPIASLEIGLFCLQLLRELRDVKIGLIMGLLILFTVKIVKDLVGLWDTIVLYIVHDGICLI